MLWQLKFCSWNSCNVFMPCRILCCWIISTFKIFLFSSKTSQKLIVIQFYGHRNVFWPCVIVNITSITKLLEQYCNEIFTWPSTPMQKYGIFIVNHCDIAIIKFYGIIPHGHVKWHIWFSNVNNKYFVL
jgi:hypothetical protein